MTKNWTNKGLFQLYAKFPLQRHRLEIQYYLRKKTFFCCFVVFLVLVTGEIKTSLG